MESSGCRGYLAHFLCYKRILYRKYVIRFSTTDEVVSCVPFEEEEPCVTFCDGILLAVAPGFPPHFCMAELLVQQAEHTCTSLVEALLSNTVYLQHAESPSDCYELYQLSPVDWHNQQFLPDTALVRIG